jgi:uncharacterized protein (DUF305 family)
VVTLTAVLGASQTAHPQETKSKTEKSSMMPMPRMNDAQFVEMMKAHHEDGIELSKLEESKGTREEVKALAAKIREGQEAELQQLQSAHSGHAATAESPAGAKPQGTAGHDAHGAAMQKHHEMMERMAAESKQKVESASGPDVDAAFLAEMSKHHQMALEMIAKTTFNDANLRKLAQKMAADQRKELGELKKLQAR